MMDIAQMLEEETHVFIKQKNAGGDVKKKKRQVIGTRGEDVYARK